MPHKFVIADRHKAEALLTSADADKFGAWVTITDPHRKFIPTPEKQKDRLVICKLSFYDIEEPVKLIGSSEVAEPPTAEGIKKLLKAAPDILAVKGKILVNCMAGVSRSAAVAYVLKSMDLGPGHEYQALTELALQRPVINPNRKIVELAQEQLGGEYDLVEEFDRWKEKFKK